MDIERKIEDKILKLLKTCKVGYENAYLSANFKLKAERNERNEITSFFLIYHNPIEHYGSWISESSPSFKAIKCLFNARIEEASRYSVPFSESNYKKEFINL